MYQICKFDKTRDLQEAIPGLSTDLHEAIKHGVVLDTGIDATYNDMEDVAGIRGRVRDAFSAIDHQRAILAAGKIVDKGNPSVSTPTGESQ